MKHLRVLSTYNRRRHVQENLFSISAIGPETPLILLSDEIHTFKGSHIFHQGETAIQGNEKKLFLLRVSTNAGHIVPYTALHVLLKNTSQLQDVQ